MGIRNGGFCDSESRIALSLHTGYLLFSYLQAWALATYDVVAFGELGADMQVALVEQRAGDVYAKNPLVICLRCVAG